MSTDHRAIVAGLAVATGVSSLYGVFVPDALSAAQLDQARVHEQQLKAGVASLILGAGCSAIARSPWPFLLAVALVALLMTEFASVRRRAG